MKKLLTLVALATFATAAGAADLAVTDWYQNELNGPGATKDLLADSGSTVAGGITAAEWYIGNTLGTTENPASHAMWANNWNGEAEDFFKLTLQLDPGYYANIDQLRQSTDSSGTGPTMGSVEIYIDGEMAWSTSYTEDGNYNNQILDVGVASDFGSTIEVYWTGTGATSDGGTYRLGNYYDGSYQASGLLGSTMVPEPVSFVLLALGALLRRR